MHGLLSCDSCHKLLRPCGPCIDVFRIVRLVADKDITTANVIRAHMYYLSFFKVSALALDDTPSRIGWLDLDLSF
uniref:Uncharacterized protein n=1 Tax=Arundo donax TaxID=35708 RepID=A0A0A9GYT1_ARUDO